jgi:hypothetical protein
VHHQIPKRAALRSETAPPALINPQSIALAVSENVCRAHAADIMFVAPKMPTCLRELQHFFLDLRQVRQQEVRDLHL